MNSEKSKIYVVQWTETYACQKEVRAKDAAEAVKIAMNTFDQHDQKEFQGAEEFYVSDEYEDEDW